MDHLEWTRGINPNDFIHAFVFFSTHGRYYTLEAKRLPSRTTRGNQGLVAVVGFYGVSHSRWMIFGIMGVGP